MNLILFLLFDLSSHLTGFRKASYLMFGEHLYAINNNIEDAAASGYQGCVSIKSLLQFFRHTGGSWLIASSLAIVNIDLQCWPPQLNAISEFLYMDHY